jgi:prolyl-tRNA editing enzyme YbaK/EbsC (Cys-tRNA(Pro) deacylase)
MTLPAFDGLDSLPALEHLDLVAAPVANALTGWARTEEVAVVEIDPDLADTAALTEAYSLPLGASVNCVLVAGSRGGEERIAACLVAADTRADVNTVVRKLLDVRKASFLPMDRAVAESGMEYGGITPIGLPTAWRVLVDAAVLTVPAAMIGSGVRRSKIILPGSALGDLPGAEVVEGLGRPTR